jgi:tyrosyl-tRNA synthetase
MTMPLLEGLDGSEKMSKSLGNYVGVNEPAPEMFGKLMSISDELMWKYYLLLTDLLPRDIDAVRAAVTSGSLHPKQVKVDLARRIVGDFHSAADAEAAAAAFDARFSRGELEVEHLPQVTIAATEPSLGLARLVVEAGLAASTSEAGRKIQQGGVKIDRERVSDPKSRVPTADDIVLEVGRRAVRVVFDRT